MTSGAFPVCGPTVWNLLPCTLRSPELSYNCFRKKLKTELFLKSCYLSFVLCVPLRCSSINCAPTCKFTNK